MSMERDRRLLLGVDYDLSLPTRYALRTACDLFALPEPQLRLLLLHVIPTSYDVTPAWGKTLATPALFPPTARKRLQAAHVLQRARALVQQRGIVPGRIELLRCAGAPADELARVAGELQVACLVLGSWGETFGRRVRRLLVGSTSQRVLQLAPCPVLVVSPPRLRSLGSLVEWYKDALGRSLNEHPGVLAAFTAPQVAQRFAPPDSTIGPREVEAARRALEQLVQSGVLCSYRLGNEIRYLND